MLGLYREISIFVSDAFLKCLSTFYKLGSDHADL